MSKKQKAPAGAPTPTEAKGRDLNRLTSRNDSTTFSCVRQPSAYLLHGAKNAISARELVKIAGFSGKRALREAVERERRAGELILICNKGYFLPSLDEAQREQEVRRFVHLMDARVRSNRLAVQPCKAYLRRRKRREIVGQAGLFDERGDEE